MYEINSYIMAAVIMSCIFHWSKHVYAYWKETIEVFAA